jgi:hypothetical protein
MNVLKLCRKDNRILPLAERWDSCGHECPIRGALIRERRRAYVCELVIAGIFIAILIWLDSYGLPSGWWGEVDLLLSIGAATVFLARSFQLIAEKWEIERCKDVEEFERSLEKVCKIFSLNPHSVHGSRHLIIQELEYEAIKVLENQGGNEDKQMKAAEMSKTLIINRRLVNQLVPVPEIREIYAAAKEKLEANNQMRRAIA